MTIGLVKSRVILWVCNFSYKLIYKNNSITCNDLTVLNANSLLKNHLPLCDVTVLFNRAQIPGRLSAAAVSRRLAC